MDTAFVPPTAPPSLPTGQVTFLLTDIERSTQQWEEAGPAFGEALLKIHHALLRQVFREYGGQEVKEEGDGVLVAFSEAGRAPRCASAPPHPLARYPRPSARPPPRVWAAPPP